MDIQKMLKFAPLAILVVLINKSYELQAFDLDKHIDMLLERVGLDYIDEDRYLTPIGTALLILCHIVLFTLWAEAS